MAPPASKWWQEPNDSDLDYGFDSDELDTRYNKLDRNSSHENQSEPRHTQSTDDRGVIGSMSSWLQRQAGSSHGQLATAAVVSGAAVAGAIFGYQSYKRKEAVHDLKASIPSLDELHPAEMLTDFGAASNGVQLSKEDERGAALARRAQRGDYDDDLILEQLARNRVFLGDEGLAKLRSSFVVVVGCGGVGSHAAASLARSGVSKIRLIDFDQVTLSSLNRHALATLADVGTPKVHCIRRRLEQVAPWVMFDCRNELYGKSVSEDLLGPWTLTHDGEGRRPDFVLDCIDNITSKVELLHYCHSNSLPVISSMGAGCKSDPTRVVVGDISLSTDDPLSRTTRRRLKLLGVSSGVAAVFSTEKPGPGKATLLPLPEDEFNKGQVGELGVLPDFRARILPVLGTMPAVFGYTAANHVICTITGYPIDYNMGAKGREKLYDTILSSLLSLHERMIREVTGQDTMGLRAPLSKDDIAFVVEEVYRGKSVVSGVSTRLALVPWQTPAHGWNMDLSLEKEGQKTIPININDLVCMTREEALHHEDEVFKGGKKVEDVYDETILQRVNLRKREAEEYDQYRGAQLGRRRMASHDSHSRDFDHDFQPTTTHHPSYPNQFTQHSRPLIDSARNGWQSSAAHEGPHRSSPADDIKPQGWTQMALSVVSAPRFRRYVLIYVALFTCAWIGWRMVLSPQPQEQNSQLHPLDPTSETDTDGLFGTNLPPQLDGLVQMHTLDLDLVPGDLAGGDATKSSRKRLVIVGDVHGCKAELVRLLKKVSFNQKGGDHLIFVGDIINKGPDSTGVVDLARQHSASSVRGNHEDRILLLRREMVKTKTLSTPDDDEEYRFSSRELSERALARSLSDEQIQWLENCPVILNVGQVSGMGQVVVVHAGLVPGVELENQDPSSVMTMRTIDLDTHVPSPKKKGMNWAKMFDKHQSKLYSSLETSAEDPLASTMTVVYGHDASTSLSIRTFTKGLDSGCVKGKKLTALVIEDGGKQSIVQVSCHNYLKE
ncbi:Molybdenum cofactor biosynthesis MoeB [Penicillium cf. griseofulvum]|uniref:Molybdenum cofactor biosynthesis MoeB n=1 Tax=Penicillium cf. griseofulvum TaxID=2972120 RepID=A0A9W9JN64_9EURO|nr:Molybdenum cofactor biosynthesis MoeB [Penicillium cf. griseofulvum]KAJ5443297.1 Molybdenum cofactor biosynthesis MoeB [Penicillium cf. griseofulvum]KAJ5451252.1 Molybdenum cofactor biosynthesis MoeB [Penicillium cf. griseofulvum]